MKIKTFYISTRESDGMGEAFAAFVRRNHPKIDVVIEKDGPQTILIDDEGTVFPQDFWGEFCNS